MLAVFKVLVASRLKIVLAYYATFFLKTNGQQKVFYVQCGYFLYKSHQLPLCPFVKIRGKGTANVFSDHQQHCR